MRNALSLLRFSFSINSFLTLLILVGFAGIIMLSCRTGGECEEPLDVRVSSIETSFIDQSSGKYIYSNLNPIYNKDSLKIVDPFGKELLLLRSLRTASTAPYEQYWDINFGNLYDANTDEQSFSSEICKNYIVRYTYNESDTIQVCFKSKRTNCGSVFEHLDIYQKNQRIGHFTNTTAAQATILKY